MVVVRRPRGRGQGTGPLWCPDALLSDLVCAAGPDSVSRQASFLWSPGRSPSRQPNTGYGRKLLKIRSRRGDLNPGPADYEAQGFLQPYRGRFIAPVASMAQYGADEVLHVPPDEVPRSTPAAGVPLAFSPHTNTSDTVSPPTRCSTLSCARRSGSAPRVVCIRAG